jgi:hypothetical protein
LDNVPTLKQISNFINRLKKADGELKQPTMDQLFEKIFSMFSNAQPADIHETFVAGTTKDEQRFVVVWTTGHLLALASNQKFLQIFHWSACPDHTVVFCLLNIIII